jgi:hypothetical protein
MDNNANANPKYEDKNLAYITLLEERNRMKKRLSGKTKEEQLHDERERGFSVHFQGANKDRTSPRAASSTAGGSASGSDKGERSDWGDRRNSAKPRVVRSTVSAPSIKVQTATNNVAGVPSAPVYDGFGLDSNTNIAADAASQRRGWNVPAAFILGRKLQLDTPSPALTDEIDSVKRDDDEDNYYDDDFVVEEDTPTNGSTEDEEIEEPAPTATSSGYGMKTDGLPQSRSSSGRLVFTPRDTNSGGSSPSPFGAMISKAISKNSLPLSVSKQSQLWQRQQSHPSLKSPQFGGLSSAAGETGMVDGAIPAVNSQQGFMEGSLRDSLSVGEAPGKIVASVADTAQNKFGDEIWLAEHGRDGTSNAVHHNSFHMPAHKADRPLKIKIRIHSSWRNTKYVSLMAIRLQHANETGRNSFLDSSLFNVELISGLQVLPKSHESAKTVMLLFSQPVKQSNGYLTWKFSQTNSLPLDICITPDAAVVNADNAAEFALRLWNYEDTGADDRVSAVRDVDIFVGLECVYSGTMVPLPGVFGSQGKNITSTAPSLIMRLDGQQPKAKVDSGIGITASVNTSVPVAASGSSPVRGTASKKLDSEGSANANRGNTVFNLPAWLQDFKSDKSELTNRLLSPKGPAPSNVLLLSPPSIRRSKELSASQPDERSDVPQQRSQFASLNLLKRRDSRGAAAQSATNAEPLSSVDVGVESTDASQRKSLRMPRRTQRYASLPDAEDKGSPVRKSGQFAQATFSSPADNIFADVDGPPQPRKVLGGRRAQEQRQDAELRQSLDAIDASNRASRGRLGVSVSQERLLVPIREEPNTPDDVETSATGTEDVEVRPPQAEPALVYEDVEAAAVIQIDEEAPETEKKVPVSRTKHRSQRIDQVTSTISMAIAGLETVLSEVSLANLTVAKKNRRTAASKASEISVAEEKLAVKPDPALQAANLMPDSTTEKPEYSASVPVKQQRDNGTGTVH